MKQLKNKANCLRGFDPWLKGNYIEFFHLYPYLKICILLVCSSELENEPASSSPVQVIINT